MAYNLNDCVDRYARIALAMGLREGRIESRARQAVAEVKKLAADINLPEFRQLGVKESDFEKLAGDSAANGSNRNNPRPMESDDYLRVLMELNEAV
jgi:alcohol dehydrogenase class IV